MIFPRKFLSPSILAACAVFALGCSKDAPAPGAAASAEAAGNKTAAAAKPTGKLSAAECQKLYEHVMDVGVAEAMKDKSATAGMSEADKKKAAEDMRKEIKNDPETKKMAAGCEKDFSRAQYDCVMKAASEKAIDACDNLE